ncbi:class I SAM-dependent DNA methyltransferase [Pseudomonas parafulva]|uniref:class I SAM-dependent DNA methyltransferase n=1 Tax=Pseudomonas parafulva TaxID=157782 RepID=UPI001FD7426A|nr:methyltransferase domain-containing protein [Pseudomonas parafulva]
MVPSFEVRLFLFVILKEQELSKCVIRRANSLDANKELAFVPPADNPIRGTYGFYCLAQVLELTGCIEHCFPTTKESEMTLESAEYNVIGGLFESFTDTAAQREVEVRTILHMVGDVHGKSILDVACGFGYFGRQLRQRGARKVVGVDISQKMIDLAREESARTGDDLEFHVRDASKMEKLGNFDMVVAAWLFNYASSLDDLENMFKCVAANLSTGGTLVAYTVEPDFELGLGNFTSYGVNVRTEEPWGPGYRHQAEFVTQPPSPFTFYRWGRADYERAAKNAGFSSLRWQKPLLLKADEQKYTPGFWDVFKDNCLQTGLVCTL